MKKTLTYIIIFLAVACKAQQTATYTQYLFNKAGMNPAAAGTNINQEYSYVFGMNRQWVDFDNSPKTTFVNLSYTIRPPRSYRRWQNVGIYADNDQSGLIGSTNIYANYTMHILIRNKLVASFGAYLGVRRFTRSISGLDANDPAVQRNRVSVTLYPDIIPGFRLSGKKFFTDISVRQISMTKLQDFKGRRIGSPSKLRPSVFFDYGRKVPLSDNLLMVPSLAANFAVIGPPSVDLDVMFYYATRIGLGLAIRNTNFASAILQIRFLENMTAGFAYSYPLNATRYASPRSFEVMVGVTPLGMDSKFSGKHSVARCPTLDY